jgi:hypothetical protein
MLNVLLFFLYFITILGKSHALFVVDSHGVSLQGVDSVFVVFVLDTEALALVFLLAFDFAEAISIGYMIYCVSCAGVNSVGRLLCHFLL